MAIVTKPARKQQAPPAPDMAPLTELAKCRPIAAGAHNDGTTPGALRLSYKIHCCASLVHEIVYGLTASLTD